MKHRPIEADGLTLFRRAVAPDLAPWVVQILGYRENGTGLSSSVEMAPLVVPLIVSFGSGFQIALGRAPRPGEILGSFTSGLYPGPVVINSSGGARCVQVDFTPLCHGYFHDDRLKGASDEDHPRRCNALDRRTG